MGTSQLSAQTQQSKTFMKPCMFYIGIVLNVLGIFLFFFGISSEKWMMMSEGSADVTPERRQKYVSNYGPWTACTHGNRCDHPWVIIRGVDRLTTLVVQSVFVVAAGLYLLVLIIIIIQRLPEFLRSFCASIENKMVVEFVAPLAAITGFIAMLMMGELKRQVIGHENQTESPGPGFAVTLCAILLTVAGILCTIFNHYQHASRKSRMAVYIQRLRRKRKTVSMKGIRRQGRQKTRLRIGVSDVHVFTVDKADSNRDAGDHNDDKDASGPDTGNNLPCEMDRQEGARGFLAAVEGLEANILEGGGGHVGRGDINFGAMMGDGRSNNCLGRDINRETEVELISGPADSNFGFVHAEVQLLKGHSVLELASADLENDVPSSRVCDIAFTQEDSFRNHGVWPVLNEATTSSPRQITQSWGETARDSSETVPLTRSGCVLETAKDSSVISTSNKTWMHSS